MAWPPVHSSTTEIVHQWLVPLMVSPPLLNQSHVRTPASNPSGTPVWWNFSLTTSSNMPKNFPFKFVGSTLSCRSVELCCHQHVRWIEAVVSSVWWEPLSYYKFHWCDNLLSDGHFSSLEMPRAEINQRSVVQSSFPSGNLPLNLQRLLWTCARVPSSWFKGWFLLSSCQQGTDFTCFNVLIHRNGTPIIVALGMSWQRSSGCTLADWLSYDKIISF